MEETNPSGRRSPLARGLTALLVAMAGVVAMPAAQAAEAAKGTQSASASHPTRAFWLDIKGTPAAVSAAGARASVQPSRFRAAALDRLSMAALVANAPQERSTAARQSPLVLSLPDPSGGFQRFRIVESPIMEAGLAAKHPEIKTYAGRGIDDPAATLRMDITPLGFHAAVRSQKGGWFIDPYYHLDDSLYVSYFSRDLPNRRGRLAEGLLNEPQVSLLRGLYHAADTVQVRAVGFAPGAEVSIAVRHTTMDSAPRQLVNAVASADGVVSATLVADPYKNLGSYDLTVSDGRLSASTLYQVLRDRDPVNATAGGQFRSYRLALLTDPSYATYFGGSANVTAAKVTLINRVSQVYEDETSIRLVLINNTDALNLDTAAQMTGANGPCGGTACFTASQAASCTSSTLTRNRQVIGLLAGASNFDIGHIALGVNGGGVASLGVVGGNNKAQGCTGIPTPVGDFFAVDYVAHEMGHQFAGNHTFNGTISNCSGGNRSATTSVEPGSGSSIMAYAGICGTDNLQPHSDPYWSQRSFDEIVTYTSAAETNINEVQMGALSNFTSNGQQFQLRYNGNDSVAIVRGTNFTTAGIKAAVEAISGWPAGGTVTVSALGDTAFTVTFGGTLAGTNTSELQLVGCSGGCTGYVGEIAKGGTTSKGGSVAPDGNNAPVVNVTASYTIPLRTPFALSGSASDADADTLTYLWEQNDRGGSTGTGLISNTKLNGPLFRQFGTRAVVTSTGTLEYGSPGENAVNTNSTRVFPDLVQILANNTNAETGLCPPASATPTATEIDCFSEFLPTADYVGFGGNASPISLNFRLTARDGRGGVNSATTTLVLAAGTGPFLVTAPNSAVSVTGGSPLAVTWSVAGTNAAPIGTTNVRISLSTDGGLTYPLTLAASTPNDGSETVTLPVLFTTTARIKVEAVGNVFFDVSNADFTIKLAGDASGDGKIDCVDMGIVKASMGKRAGQPGFDPRADLNGDGVVDIRDLSIVSQKLPAGTTCP